MNDPTAPSRTVPRSVPDTLPDDLPDRADVVVVGAGLMGAATAWQLAARGVDAVVVEQDEPASVHGSSHGSARIVRRAYAQDDYVALTGDAFELWSELERQSGRALVRLTGGIDHGPARDPAGIRQALDRAGLATELLVAAAAEERWPGMRFAGPVLYQAQAGTVDAEQAVHAYLDVARGAGVRLVTGTEVLGIDPGRADTDDTVVRTSAGDVSCRRVVVAAGAWCADLLGGAVGLPPLRVTEHRVFHFPRLDESLVWPVTIHLDDLDVYHLPGGRDGGLGDARKVAEHVGRPSDARHRDSAVDVAARERIVRYVERWLPGLVPEPFAEATCLYTTTPSEDFVVDRVGGVVVVSACSGHGAKLSPVVGRLAAELATTAATPHPRFALAGHTARPTTECGL